MAAVHSDRALAHSDRALAHAAEHGLDPKDEYQVAMALAQLRYLHRQLQNPHPLLAGLRDKLWVFKRMGVANWAQFGSLSTKQLSTRLQLLPMKRLEPSG